jgi:hypothetical protein
MDVIRIGADEIILWLRKNNKQQDVANVTIFKNIHELIIKRLDGIIIQEDETCIWPLDDDDKINENHLPKSAPQYLIKAEKTVDLYKEINTWY